MPRTLHHILMIPTILMSIAITSHAQAQGGSCGDGYCDYPEEDEFNCPIDCAGICGDGRCNPETEDEWSCPEDCGYCGDGYCAETEDEWSCPVDCGYCGDGICAGGQEDPENCYVDCGTCGDGTCNFEYEDEKSCYDDCGFCGDGICDWENEGQWECYEDCGSPCGDGICWFNETEETCLEDCGYCGDGICDVDTEDPWSCPDDCGYCGDGICDFEYEDEFECPEDCGYCGDGYCNGTEDGLNCYLDCGYCGDGLCDPENESQWECFEDCGSPCGDGICWFNETVESCPEDCATCGDGICSPTENTFDCPSDCGVCGDGTCDPGEEGTCFSDCGLPCWGTDTSCGPPTQFRGFDLNPILRDSPTGAYMVLEVYATFEQAPGVAAPKVFALENATVTTADGVGFHHDDLKGNQQWDPYWTFLIPGISDPAYDSHVSIGMETGPQSMLTLDDAFLNGNNGVGPYIPVGSGWTGAAGGVDAIPYEEVPWNDPLSGGYYGNLKATHALKLGQFSMRASRMSGDAFFTFEGTLSFETTSGRIDIDQGVIGFPACVSCSDLCNSDLDGDGNVGGSDIAMLLAQWGGPGDADLDGNGKVDGSDLTIILATWGQCPDSN